MASEGVTEMKPVKFSHSVFDAADYADEQSSCCKIPLRWGTLTFSLFFIAAGAIQTYEQIVTSSTWENSEFKPEWRDSAHQVLGVEAVSMFLGGICGLVGCLFQIRYPVTFFAFLLLVQIALEICWFVIAERAGSKNAFETFFNDIYTEVLSGNRKGESPLVGHLFYTLFSVQFHFWVCAIAASYALELKIMGKAMWFEPVFDDDDADEEAPLLDKDGAPNTGTKNATDSFDVPGAGKDSASSAQA